MVLGQLINAARERGTDRATLRMTAGSLLSPPLASAPRHPLRVLHTIAVQPCKSLVAAESLLRPLPIHSVQQAAADCYAGEHRLPQDLKMSIHFHQAAVSEQGPASLCHWLQSLSPTLLPCRHHAAVPEAGAAPHPGSVHPGSPGAVLLQQPEAARAMACLGQQLAVWRCPAVCCLLCSGQLLGLHAWFTCASL